MFLSYEFSYEKCSECFPNIFEPFNFVGPKKSPAKFPPKFPPNFPAKTIKIHRRASAGAQREGIRPLSKREGIFCNDSFVIEGKKNVFFFAVFFSLPLQCAAKGWVRGGGVYKRKQIQAKADMRRFQALLKCETQTQTAAHKREQT